MATLYEMTNEIAELYSVLQNTELNGEEKETIIATQIEGMGATEKVEGYCQIIKQLSADKAMFDEEIKRLQAKKKTAENGIERLKSGLLAFLQSSNQKKIEAGTFSVSRRESKSVNVFSIGLLPPKYLLPQEPKIDKKAIAEALKRGESVTGAEFEIKEGVTIK